MPSEFILFFTMKNRTIKLLFFLVIAGQPCLLAAIEQNLDTAADSIVKAAVKKIEKSRSIVAVAPFLNPQNKITELGIAVAQNLMQKLEEHQEVPASLDFTSKLTEQMKPNFASMGDPKFLQNVGKFSRADYVLTGILKPDGNNLEIQSVLIQTETGKRLKKTSIILQGSPDIVESLAKEVRDQNAIAVPSGVESKIPDFQALTKEMAMLQEESIKVRKQLSKAGKQNQSELKAKLSAIEQNIKADEFLGSAAIELQIQDNIGAINSCSKALEMKSPLPEALFFRGVANLKRENRARAIDDLTHYLDENPADASGFLLRGIAYFRNGENSRAMDDFNQTVKLNPKLSEAFYWRGTLEGVLGKIREQRKDLEEACYQRWTAACEAFGKLR